MDRALAFAFAALVLFGCALSYPFLGFSKGGSERSMSLVDAGKSLIDYGDRVLGLLVLGLMVLAPLVSMSIVLILGLTMRADRRFLGARALARVLHEVQHWNMVDVFFIGVLVSLTKIASMATVQLGPAFWAYTTGTVCVWLVMHSLGPRSLLEASSGDVWSVDGESCSESRADTGLAVCHVCRSIHDTANSDRCHVCNARVHLRTPGGLQVCLAWLITAGILYIPASVLPIMTTNQLGRTSSNTIVEGVVTLWRHGSYPIAIVIFVASVLVPMLKILAICWLCWAASRDATQGPRQLTRLYEMTELLGRWSMVDVFVVALLVALVQVGGVLAIQPGPAALAFAAVVACTMLSARAFDQRLLWNTEIVR